MREIKKDMAQSSGSTDLLFNVDVLKGQASKTAYMGAYIAIASIVIATLIVCYMAEGGISIDGVIAAQKSNFGLWVLDALPFIFMMWGQYSSSIIAYHAGAMVLEQTSELRSKAVTLEKQAAYSATHDALTDLPNRSLFYDRVEQAILSANSHNKTLSIVLFEIENYKEIYDTLGRNNSDLVLKQISSRLQGVLQHYDNVARLEGSTFSLLIHDEQENALQVVNNIQESMQSAFIVERLHVAVHSGAGIVYFPEHGEDVDTLVQRAGIALYMARNSKEGHAVYDPSFDQHSPQRLTMMSELRHAIQRDELVLHYQAKVSLETNTVHGVEALIRWNHPKHGFIPPEEFILMAERTRTIQQVTTWVLRQAFNDCAKWNLAGKNLKVSINLSTKDLHDPELPDFIEGIRAATKVNPGWIIFEITEGSIMTDPEQAMEILQRLDGMGYNLSIDDFGTGYSSLAYLKKMPLSELKIDRSFVQDLISSENDAVIVSATINLAHNLGLKIVAEGVENKETLSKLKEYGCDIAQGYYINKPLTFEELDIWLEDSQWQLVGSND
jgi:diguanylate cyclase (GGDEF)-like protein